MIRLRYMVSLLFSQKPLLLASMWGWVEVSFFPQPMLLIFLATSMLINLFSGVIKSWKKGIFTSREGLQRTIVKISRYSMVILSVWVLVNIIHRVDHVDWDYTGFINGIIVFLSIVELYSVFENLEELDPGGPLSKIIRPILRLLNSRLKNNVASEIGNALDESKPNPKSHDTSN